MPRIPVCHRYFLLYAHGRVQFARLMFMYLVRLSYAYRRVQFVQLMPVYSSGSFSRGAAWEMCSKYRPMSCIPLIGYLCGVLLTAALHGCISPVNHRMTCATTFHTTFGAHCHVVRASQRVVVYVCQQYMLSHITVPAFFRCSTPFQVRRGRTQEPGLSRYRLIYSNSIGPVGLKLPVALPGFGSKLPE